MSKVFTKTISTPVEIPSLIQKKKKKFIMPIRSKSDLSSVCSYSGIVTPEPIKIRKIRPPSTNWSYEKFSLEIDDIISSTRKNNIFFPSYQEEKKKKIKNKKKLKNSINNKNNKQSQNKNTNKMEMDLDQQKQEESKINTNTTNNKFEKQYENKIKHKEKEQEEQQEEEQEEKQEEEQEEEQEETEEEEEEETENNQETEKEEEKSQEDYTFIETEFSNSNGFLNTQAFSHEPTSILQSEFEIEMDSDLEESIKSMSNKNNEGNFVGNLPFSPPNRTKCPLIMDNNFLKIIQQINEK
ncbi:hypothetical protein M0812_01976 [Anaeramoeba flamelloides]|uniref:Uncharacterized protein n=1 Tax=Anaeramoeba flamelloides TaxID=1746091 RepID=A0AAV7Z3R5_9EUKA|nr:hypothetical protein M0812_01976 [Anaeramoeba flamelloides]